MGCGYYLHSVPRRPTVSSKYSRLCTREIVGWRLGDRMTTELVIGALEDAYKAKKPKKGLIHHSDRGSQYASGDYRNKLSTYKMKASMSRKGIAMITLVSSLSQYYKKRAGLLHKI